MSDFTGLNPSESGSPSVDLPAPGSAIGQRRRRASYAILALACTLGVALMGFRHGPNAATASEVGAAGTATRDGLAGDAVASDVANLRDMQKALSESRAVIDGFRFIPSRVQVQLSDLRANPFHAQPARETAENADDADTVSRGQ